MTAATHLTEWDELVADVMARAMFSSGWSRALPPAGVTLLMGTACRLRLVHVDEFSGPLGATDGQDVWRLPCWPVPETFGGDFLADLRENYSPEDAEKALAMNAAIEATHAAEIAVLDGYAAHLGLGPVRTNGDLLELLVTAGALHRDGDLVGPVHPMPQIDDVFPVAAAERAVLADLRALDM
ncbi:hypothetical protein OV450_1449 [Actinobacteria bacterium OV450]|nr:hypothetical protein OV450_1449 [Actinobacteria bacterium OV450]